ncbi:hypothetical protein Pmani_013274 [Petrolisthes manimaculis]|uniref:Uncharacterized protein n=1 Tax=Petrolisthes manimaculis TaxID=1843537 RepID=A0AAE1U9H9_9EUCA|nr:hypothetical protein Pmani_013274 [Petrolisthes manimaculis]
MKIRGQRPSDVVAAVCVPASLFLFLNLLLLSPPPPSSITTLQDATTNIQTQSPTTTTATTTVRKIGPSINTTGGEGRREDLLLFTPILRCASTSLINLLGLLSKHNNFHMQKRPRRKAELVHIPKVDLQREMVANISKISTPSVVIESAAYINFTVYGKERPIRVSLVRDPVERAVSWYYHARAPYHLVERHAAFPDTILPSRAFLKKDLESCLKSRSDTECRYIPGKEMLGHTVEFFCGHQDFCPIFGDMRALLRAKEVVEREWAVVGVLEEWNNTLHVLHHYIPRFFEGASQLYYEHLHHSKTKTNTNFYKPQVDPKAKEFLKTSFHVEYEFYEFVKQRLHRQYRALNTANDL